MDQVVGQALSTFERMRRRPSMAPDPRSPVASAAALVPGAAISAGGAVRNVRAAGIRPPRTARGPLGRTLCARSSRSSARCRARSTGSQSRSPSPCWPAASRRRSAMAVCAGWASCRSPIASACCEPGPTVAFLGAGLCSTACASWCLPPPTQPGPSGATARGGIWSATQVPRGRPATGRGQLRPMSIAGSTQLSCDVVVVGSGAGGGPAAAVLADAGLDVIVVEKGGHYHEADFDGAELAGTRRMYRGFTTRDRQRRPGRGLLSGRWDGHDYTSSFQTPRAVREEWATLGASAFAEPEYDRALEAVCDRLAVNSEHSRPSPRDQLLQDGLAALGWRSGSHPAQRAGL